MWMDRDCKLRTRADLDKILANHRLWWDGNFPRSLEEKSIPERVWHDPLRAKLSGAQLDYADLTGEDLSYADLSGARIESANLAGAQLNGADCEGISLRDSDLTRAQLSYADLIDADLLDADLTGADVDNADLTGAGVDLAVLNGADLDYADLSGATLENADLTNASLISAKVANLAGADFEEADLTGAYLGGADLTGADLGDADLNGANLGEVDLSGADLARAELWNADFEPKAMPAASNIARANGLRTLRWNSVPTGVPRGPWWLRLWRWFGDRNQRRGNRNPMQDLRKEFHDAGYLDAEREVNLAYHRMEQSWWEEIVFDWSCEWGANWRRPLGIAAGLGVVCSVLYWFLLRFTRRNRLFVIGKNGKREQRLRVGSRGPAPGWFQTSDGDLFYPWCGVVPLWRRVRWEMRLYWTAALFSLMSVLNLGVQGFDLGRWVRLMHRRDFDLEARGTIRAIAGVQSVVSFALLALAALSYFGHPFE